MSIKHGLLTILSTGPSHGYLMRQEFEARTGGTWPINISQIYSTLQRLERDGLVTTLDDSEPVAYSITAAGRTAVQNWWYSPTLRSTPERSEVSIKIALAVTTHGIDIERVITAQRIETMRALRDYTILKANLPSDSDAETTGTPPPTKTATEQAHSNAWELVLDSYIFTLEAEARWLDHIETRAPQLQRQVPNKPTAGATAKSGSAAIDSTGAAK
ncbi:PadR family transcriptional regulator [Jonesiaceae bacterium BS-20]|uniref:PadR family transcriptional regulator n=1 Tax=Jonesiaceae bacterium BS-20 TaxID=3120821 RepID=A0AAU7DUW0_9MICO